MDKKGRAVLNSLRESVKTTSGLCVGYGTVLASKEVGVFLGKVERIVILVVGYRPEGADTVDLASEE